jgi:uncharacterized protein (DUF488 family)
VIYTIGHSTRSAEAFVELLRVHAIGQIADIRTIPYSRRHPHFSKEVLESYLEREGFGYRHFPALGGLRKSRRDSPNTALRHPGFRGYADYMGTQAFTEGVESLLPFTAVRATALMCAESVWWQCHRRLLADALVVRGFEVRHILSSAGPKPHELSEFARVDGGVVTYPGLHDPSGVL